ncbi:helix-turn-helix transcriptional regulator [Agromyces protaetiae]|uniref:Helix-turn-helix transcriptional regulator n=1 Tax=Agromyces protaetiae TaxID=2509455 RepID=A0A4P6FNW4_9MICO|nr:LuxR family transcriptional regulator [Agromyces protaetiae]QAY72168.1 helix-turn-helix transcriptional regulator [Agromyces protaetiae]
MNLLGREDESAALDRLLDEVRAGFSRALVVTGEPGVGKTALLHRLTTRASDFRVIEICGVQSEMEIAFAALHQLCAPHLGRLEAIPTPQADALRITLGLREGKAPDRLLVGLGLLSLLAELGTERPLLCIVDDEHWLDHASAQLIAFVARRLDAESVGIVFGARGVGDELAGLPQLGLAPLDPTDAGALLDSMLAGRIDPRVREQLLVDTDGNPLAVVELARELTASRLSGGYGLPDAFAEKTGASAAFSRRIAALPDESRRLLVLAAVDPTGDPILLWNAAAVLGVPARSALAVSDAELVEFGARVRFRHPLVRSAAHRSATGLDLRNAHAALAAATNPATDPDRRAWHRAAAADGPDGRVAAELERSADRARARGGLAAAAAFLERAVILTPDVADRARRVLAAARAKLAAGAFEDAGALLDLVDGESYGEVELARARALRAQLAFAADRDARVPAMLLEAAEASGPLDPEFTRETMLDALRAAVYVGRLANPDADLSAVAAAAVSRTPTAPEPDDAAFGELAPILRTRAGRLPPFADVLVRVGHSASADDPRWLSLLAFAAAGLWNSPAWDRLTARYVEVCRDQGALSELRLALTARIYALLTSGRMPEAHACLEELAAALSATQSSLASYGAVAAEAFLGRRDAVGLAEVVVADARRRGEGLAITATSWAVALLHNGLGRYEDALEAAVTATAYSAEDLGLGNWGLVELVEAATRARAHDTAAEALERLRATTRGIDTDWARGIVARCAALLATDDDAERAFQEAIEHLDRGGLRPDAARARLLYGEWLRRERRPADARVQLRAAHEMLTTIGMAGFAERARLELRAAGERTRIHAPSRQGELTAQEAHIAQLARSGLSNPEIGTRLFISARTVEYHLGKIFSKLGIRSRSQLEDRLD